MRRTKLKKLRVRPERDERDERDELPKNIFKQLVDCGIILSGLEGQFYCDKKIYGKLIRVSEALEAISGVIAGKIWREQNDK